MKIRTGFVSNSSSTSFVCEICHNADSTWDGGLEEMGFCECQNGHVICLDHLLIKDPERNEDQMVPSKACPICMLKTIPDHVIKQYLLKRMNLTDKEVLKDIKDNFGTYEKLSEFCWTQPKQ
jgi:hypothetical protein